MTRFQYSLGQPFRTILLCYRIMLVRTHTQSTTTKQMKRKQFETFEFRSQRYDAARVGLYTPVDVTVEIRLRAANRKKPIWHEVKVTIFADFRRPTPWQRIIRWKRNTYVRTHVRKMPLTRRAVTV